MGRKLIFIFCLFVFTCFTLIANAQDSLNSKKHENILNIAIGADLCAGKFYTDNIATSFKQQNLPVALNNMPFCYKFNIFMQSLTPQTKLTYRISYGYANQTSTNANIKLNANAIFNDYTFDYVAWRHGRQYFYPGLGWGWMRYKFSFNDENSNLSYPSALQNFNGERNIQSGTLYYLNMEANYNYAIDKTANLLLGIHGEYHLGLNSKTMQLTDGQNLSQSPTINANSFFIGLSIIVQ